MKAGSQKFSFWGWRKSKPGEILLLLFEKDRKVPVWLDRAVKCLDYSFSDSSYEMPGGVLSYIRRVHTKLLLRALKTELPIKYSALYMGGNTQACLHGCCCCRCLREESRLGPELPITCTKALLHVSRTSAETKQPWSEMCWHTERDAELWLPDTPSFFQQNVAVFMCVYYE